VNGFHRLQVGGLAPISPGKVSSENISDQERRDGSQQSTGLSNVRKS